MLTSFVRENSGTHRLLVTGTSLDQHLMNAVLPGAEFLTFTGRMYPLERCIIAESNTDEILKLCAQLICIMIEMDRGAGTSATPRVPLRAPPSGEVPARQHATLILGTPPRLPVCWPLGRLESLQAEGAPKRVASSIPYISTVSRDHPDGS